MNAFKALYTRLESLFFQTITRKIAGNLFFLLFFQLIIMALLLWSQGEALELIRNTESLGELGNEAATILTRARFWAMVFLAMLLAATVGVFLFLRHLILSPIGQIHRVFDQIANNEGDLSQQVRCSSQDEFRQLAERCNAALRQLGLLFEQIRETGLQIAVNTVQVDRKVTLTTDDSQSQRELSDDIEYSSTEARASQQDISNRVQDVCSAVSDNLKAARNSLEELNRVEVDVTQMHGKIDENQATITRLREESQKVQEIVTLIRSISSQTSLLALNAAIEAARAGQAGKGFSIVADEVKKLASEVSHASTDIEKRIEAMLEQIGRSHLQAGEIARVAEETKGAIGRAGESFTGMVRDFERSDDQLQGITSAVEELTSANEEIHGKITRINRSSQRVGENMAEGQQLTESLKHITEELLESVGRIKTGNGALEGVIDEGRRFQQEVGGAIEELRRQGEEAFDRNYRPIPDTDPVKYRTGYDEAFARRIQPLCDQVLSRIPGCTFAIGVDANGYAPTHNSQYAQPPTGNPETDLARSRDKRLFNDPTGLRSARNRNSLLLQTYMRDTGELLCDLSFPVLIDGKHWGAVRLGFSPTLVLPAASS